MYQIRSLPLSLNDLNSESLLTSIATMIGKTKENNNAYFAF